MIDSLYFKVGVKVTRSRKVHRNIGKGRPSLGWDQMGPDGQGHLSYSAFSPQPGLVQGPTGAHWCPLLSSCILMRPTHARFQIDRSRPITAIAGAQVSRPCRHLTTHRSCTYWLFKPQRYDTWLRSTANPCRGSRRDERRTILSQASLAGSGCLMRSTSNFACDLQSSVRIGINTNYPSCWAPILDCATAVNEPDIFPAQSDLAAVNVQTGVKEKVTGAAIYGVRDLDDVGGVHGQDSANG